MAFEETSAEAAFAANLRDSRTANGLTQAEVAEHMANQGFRWHPPTVYKVENGERQLQLGEALELARLFGERVEDMATPGDAVTRVRASIARVTMRAELTLAGLRLQISNFLVLAAELNLMLLETPDLEGIFPADELANMRWLADSELTALAKSLADMADAHEPPTQQGVILLGADELVTLRPTADEKIHESTS